MNKATEIVISHMIEATENFIEYAKADSAHFTPQVVASMRCTARLLREALGGKEVIEIQEGQ